MLIGHKGDGFSRGGSAFEEGVSEKVCEFRASLHLSLPQPRGLTKAK